ncbi:hypothetical protein ACFV1F_25410 [Streptomyces sp. NPDC059590]|uniref:hypothetical protein n=1 Tax=Streptomyces sp. NPDC059590 TaxID=3346877 RepID=UPI003692911D
MRFISRAASAVGAAALIVGGFSAAPASAADGKTCVSNQHPTLDVWTGRGCFIGNGDDIEATDLYADGQRTVVDWYTDYGREGECDNALGTGWTVTCDYDLTETGRIKFRVCARSGGINRDCTGWTGWTGWISIRTGEAA